MAPTFLSLPPELRLMIYSFSLDDLATMPDNNKRLDRTKCSLNLLHICSEVRRESLDVVEKHTWCEAMKSFESLCEMSQKGAAEVERMQLLQARESLDEVTRQIEVAREICELGEVLKAALRERVWGVVLAVAKK